MQDHTVKGAGRLTVVCPDRHQRAKSDARITIRIPDTYGYSGMIVLYAELHATFCAPWSLGGVRNVEDIGDATHESHCARAWVEVTNVALSVVNFRLPWLCRWRRQCLL